MLKPAFQEACRAACESLARDTADGGPAVLVGCLGSRTARCTTPRRCSTAGRIEAVRFKVDLPDHGVFDEKRVSTRVPRRPCRKRL